MDEVLETLEKGTWLRGLGEMERNSASFQFPERHWKSYQTTVKVEKRREMSKNHHRLFWNLFLTNLISLIEKTLVATGKTIDILSWLQQDFWSSPKWHFQTESGRRLLFIQRFWSPPAAFLPFPSSLVGGNQCSNPRQHWNIFFLVMHEVHYFSTGVTRSLSSLQQNHGNIQTEIWPQQGYLSWKNKNLSNKTVEEVETCLTGCDWAENSRT